MTRSNKILACFNAEKKLSIENKEYQEFATGLFNFLLDADIGRGDASQYPADAYKKRVECAIVAKERGIVSGVDIIRFLLDKYKVKSLTDFSEGDTIDVGQILLKIQGDAGTILALERTILNILQRLCGIATMTSKYKHCIQRDDCYIIGTRKTLFGLWDKKAVQAGGGLSHRLNLKDGAMLKENHLNLLRATGDDDYLLDGLKAVLKNNKALRFIEVEVTSEEEFWTVTKSMLRLNSDIHKVIMFDHFTIGRIKTIIEAMQRKGIYNEILLEASGNVDLNSVGKYAESGVDVISSGALTHSVKGLDLSLLFDYKK